MITINVANNNFLCMVFRDCGTAITINQGNLVAGYITISDEEGTNYNVSISRIIFNNNTQEAVAISRSTMLNINNCYFNNNNNYAIYTTRYNNNLENNEFNKIYFSIYCEKIYYPNEIHYNYFYKIISGIQSSRSINNINNNYNFYGSASYFICILSSISPYSLVSSDVNATNNYWAMENVDHYLADAEDDPRCSYHIIYLPKLSAPVDKAGIQ